MSSNPQRGQSKNNGAWQWGHVSSSSPTPLPQDEQKVNVYYMLLTVPKEISEEENAISGDRILYDIIERKNEINAAIIAILEDMSI